MQSPSKSFLKPSITVPSPSYSCFHIPLPAITTSLSTPQPYPFSLTTISTTFPIHSPFTYPISSHVHAVHAHGPLASFLSFPHKNPEPSTPHYKHYTPAVTHHLSHLTTLPPFILAPPNPIPIFSLIYGNHACMHAMATFISPPSSLSTSSYPHAWEPCIRTLHHP